MNINDVRIFLDFCRNKAQVSGSITTQQYNLLADRAQKQKFEQDFSVFIETESITEYLATFIRTATLNIDTQGHAPYPSDFAHLASLNYYFVRTSGQGKMIPVTEVDNADFSEVEASSLLKPTKRFPKFTFYANYLAFLPRNLGTMGIDYFKIPDTPKWAFTTVNSREVYDPSNSVQFESPDFAMNDVMALMLSFMGINIQVPMLVQYAQEFKANNK